MNNKKYIILILLVVTGIRCGEEGKTIEVEVGLLSGKTIFKSYLPKSCTVDDVLKIMLVCREEKLDPQRVLGELAGNSSQLHLSCVLNRV